MTALAFRCAGEADAQAVTELWRRAGLTRAHNDPMRDFAFALAGPASDVLVGERDDGQVKELVAAAMVGHDGHRGTVYYLAVAPGAQGAGLGRATMAAVEDWLKARGVWKLNLLIRADNTKVQGFYEALGYQVEPRTAMAKWLEEPVPSD